MNNVSVSVAFDRTTPLDPAVVGGSVVRFDPPLTFTAPAVMTLHYDPAQMPSGIDETELTLHQLVGGVWRPVASRVFAVENEVNASVTSTGTFSVRWVEPSGACGSRDSAQFDFWVGAWNFTVNGTAGGTNDITRESGGCLIQEHFLDRNGAVGRSVSFVSPLDGLWHQTYVDSGGTRQILIGRFEDGRMRLYETPALRYSWLAESADRVRYFEERSADGGSTWTVGFDSAYTRR